MVVRSNILTLAQFRLHAWLSTDDARPTIITCCDSNAFGDFDQAHIRENDASIAILAKPVGEAIELLVQVAHVRSDDSRAEQVTFNAPSLAALSTSSAA